MEEETCPFCGEIMEKGFLIGPRGITWWPNMPLPKSWYKGESIAPSARALQWGCPHLPAHRCKKCKIILIQAPEMEIEPH